MKKMYSFLMFVVLMSMVSAQGWADNVSFNSEFLTSGTKYTSSNSTVISSGSILYDRDAKTLTLDNLETTGSFYISNNTSLTIILKGNNTINTGEYAITMNGSDDCPDQTLTFISDGTGTLNMSKGTRYSIKSYSGSILIKNCTINALGGGFYGCDTHLVNLTIDNATVNAKGYVQPDLYIQSGLHDFNSITLKNCAVTSPESTEFKKPYLIDKSTNEKCVEVVIEPVSKKITMPENCLSFTSQEDDTRISFKKVGDYNQYNPKFVYSKDGENWYDFVLDDEIPLPNDKTPVYVMLADKAPYAFAYAKNDKAYVNFESTGKVKAAGNIMTLLDNTGATTTVPQLGFQKMFFNCTNLVQAPDLPAKKVETWGYLSMFEGCTGLTAAPKIQATNLQMYSCEFMFMGCTGLTTAGDLSATSLADMCCSCMFYGCKNLKKAPALPATRMVLGCYKQMFGGCTSLTTAPKLPATKLAKQCYYYMFKDCENLQLAPTLPAEQLAEECYYKMFNGCKKLVGITVRFSDWNTSGNSTTGWLSGVETTNGVFRCPDNLNTEPRSVNTVPDGWSLRRIKLFKKPADCFQFLPNRLNATIKFEKVGTAPSVKLLYSYDGYEWDKYSLDQPVTIGTSADERTVYFIADDKNETFATDASNRVHITITSQGPNLIATGNIMYLLDRTGKQNSVPDYCFYKLFSDNTYLLAPPALPATTLGKSCYEYMFANDTNLKQAPELPAQTLNTYSYSHMFDGCSKVSKVTVGFTGWHANATSNWLKDVASTGTFVCPSELNVQRGISYIPTGWTAIDNNIVGVAKLIQELNQPSTTVTVNDVNTLVNQILEK